MHPLLFLENKHIPEQVMYMLFIIVFLSLLSFLSTRRLAVYPGKFQNVMEVIIGGIDSLLSEIMGHNGRQFFPTYKLLI